MDHFASTCSEIANAIEENKKISLESKKRLAEETKAFQMKPDEEKLTDFIPFLKLFFAEIDAISKRARYAESSFLEQIDHFNQLHDNVTHQKDLEINALKLDLEVKHHLLEDSHQEIDQLKQQLLSFNFKENTQIENLPTLKSSLDIVTLPLPPLIPSPVTSPVPVLVQLNNQEYLSNASLIESKDSEISQLKQQIHHLTLSQQTIPQDYQNLDRYKSRAFELETDRDRLRRECAYYQERIKDLESAKNQTSSSHLPRLGSSLIVSYVLKYPKIKYWILSYLAGIHFIIFIALFKIVSLETQYYPMLCYSLY
jgi:hypothetical protein